MRSCSATSSMRRRSNSSTRSSSNGVGVGVGVVCAALPPPPRPQTVLAAAAPAPLVGHRSAAATRRTWRHTLARAEPAGTGGKPSGGEEGKEEGEEEDDFVGLTSEEDEEVSACFFGAWVALIEKQHA